MLAEGGERGRGPGVSRRMHRGAGAHPRVQKEAAQKLGGRVSQLRFSQIVRSQFERIVEFVNPRLLEPSLVDYVWPLFR